MSWLSLKRQSIMSTRAEFEAALANGLAAVFLLTGLFVCAGCATKTYGRQSALTDAEKNNLTCPEIALEMGKTFNFMNQVNKGSQASAGDVVAQLVDSGSGNETEKKAALESAEKRLSQLKEVSVARKCSAPAV